MALALIFYGTLAALALWATWRDDDLRLIGIALAIGWAISNILHARFAVTVLPGPYSLIEFMVLSMVALAWDTHRNFWPLLIIGGVNIVSICANIGFAATFPPLPRQVFAFEVTTNICFAIECLLASGVGIFDGFRSGRFHRLPRLWRRVVAAYAARSKSEQR